MNNSGEAADQVIRMYLNGVEVAAKLSGSAAKHVAVMLYAVLRDQTKTKGKTRLTHGNIPQNLAIVAQIGHRFNVRHSNAPFLRLVYAILSIKSTTNFTADRFSDARIKRSQPLSVY